MPSGTPVRLPAQSRTGATELRTLGGSIRCQGGLPGNRRVGEAGVEPAQPKRPDYSRVFSPHDQLALGVPDGYCPRSCPGHSRAPRSLGPGTGRPGRCRTCCLRLVKAALYPDELQAGRAPGEIRTPTLHVRSVAQLAVVLPELGTRTLSRPGDLRRVESALFRLSYTGMAVATRIELATSGLTGQRSNRLSYATLALGPGFEPGKAD